MIPKCREQLLSTRTATILLSTVLRMFSSLAMGVRESGTKLTQSIAILLFILRIVLILRIWKYGFTARKIVFRSFCGNWTGNRLTLLLLRNPAVQDQWF